MSMSSASGYHLDAAYLRNGIYNCKICKQFIPMRSMEEHNALKHNVKQGDSDNDKENRPLDAQSFLSRNFQNPTRNASEYSNYTVDRNDHHKAPSIQASEIFRSEFREPKSSTQKSRDMADQSPMPHISRVVTRNADMLPAKKPKSSRLIANLTNGIGMHKGRDGSLNRAKRKIRTIFEMFEIPRPDSPDNGNSAVNGNSGGKMNRRPFSVVKKPAVKKPVVIPENHTRCKLCLNIMHKVTK